METINDVPVLLRREIEARMVAPFLEAFAEELGWERTQQITREVIAGLARQSGAECAELVGGNTFEHFKKVFPSFSKGGALEAQLHVEEDGSCLRMDVTRCRYADMYRRIGLEKLGPLLSCDRDGYFFEGFNPKVEFSRPHTIMAGDERCDFCMKKKD